MTAVLRANRLKSFDTSVLVTGCLVLIVISMVIPLPPAMFSALAKTRSILRSRTRPGSFW